MTYRGNEIKPRMEYPRPEFEREAYLNLNGEWQFQYDDGDIGLKEQWYEKRKFDRTIIVPYTYLCELSGINETEFHDIVWYQKEFSFDDFMLKDRILLHFGAVDYEADVWVNGRHLVHHLGGNVPFQIDISDAANRKGSNTITVRARDDSFDLGLPRGKQYWKPESESIFYTRTVGIWQTVWIESVSRNYIEAVRIHSELDNKFAEMDFQLCGRDEKYLEVEISLNGHILISDRIKDLHGRVKRKFYLNEEITLDWNVQESWVWSPENPVLFDVKLTVFAEGKVEPEDSVQTYFAFRKISVENGKVMLNNRPYYMKMVLDQGYWPQSLLTAPTDDHFVRDILSCKEMGFNGARKHQKVEDPRYLYWADKLGFLVWGESASAYVYSQRYVERATSEWLQILRRDYNHPCIVAWVPLNESWGVLEIMGQPQQQAHSLSLYYMIKSLDQTRMVISNDGWHHTKSDIVTIHDYESSHDILEERYASIPSIIDSTPGERTIFAHGFRYQGEPIVVSEFGGIAFSMGKHTGWGYSNSSDENDFTLKYQAVVSAIMESPYVQGFVYTQLTDVENEINGLLTYDRKYKVNPDIIRQINEKKWIK